MKVNNIWFEKLHVLTTLWLTNKLMKPIQNKKHNKLKMYNKFLFVIFNLWKWKFDCVYKMKPDYIQ